MSQLFKHEARLYYPLEEKVLLVSGAAAGIGAATAKLLAQSGYKKLALVKNCLFVTLTNFLQLGF